METVVYESGSSSYLIGAAKVARRRVDVAGDDSTTTAEDWSVDKSSPFITWISGDFVEGDKPNSNTQFFTAGDLDREGWRVSEQLLTWSA